MALAVATVVDEIGSWVPNGNDGVWPANSLAAMDMMVDIQNTLARVNAKNPNASE